MSTQAKTSPYGIIGFRVILSYAHHLDAEAIFELLEKLPMLRPTHCSDNERKRIKYSRALAVEISQRNNNYSGHFVCFWHRLGTLGCNVLFFNPTFSLPRTIRLDFLGKKSDLAQAIEDVAVFCEATAPNLATYRLLFDGPGTAPKDDPLQWTNTFEGNANSFPTGMSYPAAELYQEFGLGPLPYGTFIGAAMKPYLQPLLDSIGYGYAGDHRWLLARPTAELILDEELYLKGLERSYRILLKHGLVARWHRLGIAGVAFHDVSYYFAPNWKPLPHWSPLPPPDHRRSRLHQYVDVLPNLEENQDPPIATLAHRRCQRLNFTSADLRDISFDHATLEDIDFTGADLRGCDFRGATFKNVTWTGANLEGALFDAGAKPEV